ncbi:hypothetical protein BKA70DRAFT_1442732 [Coprinopsis sp. MPI-PUGE-AT-0042]|nr:hypothetical protein BKA70DRAFT_1442732 [Coprinopsis sp. MPI-PUGE-AT-0042]
MCTTDPNTPQTTSRRLVERPIVSRRFMRGLSLQAGRGQPATPAPARRARSSLSRTNSSQSSVSLPVANLLASAGPLTFGPPFPPLHSTGTGAGDAASHPQSSLLPSAPIGTTGLNFSYPQAAYPMGWGYLDPRSPLDPENARLFPAGESSSSNIQGPYTGATGRTLGSAFSPRTRERIISGKRRMTRAASATLQGLLNSPQAPNIQASVSAPSSGTGDRTESEMNCFPQILEILEYVIPDSDDSSSSSSSTRDEDASNTSASNAPSMRATDPVADMIERLRTLEDAPHVSSDSITQSSDSDDGTASFHQFSFGAEPSFMTASTNQERDGSPITIRDSSTEPEIQVPRSARLRNEPAPFFDIGLDASFAQGIDTFNPIEPISMLLLNLTHPGSGITPKELQSILRRCKHCSKFCYVLSQGRHICDRYAEPSIDEDYFQLQHYLSVYDEPLGLSLKQLGRVFVRCGDCDRVMWSRKKHNHICPRDARRASESQASSASGSRRPAGRAGGSGARQTAHRPAGQAGGPSSRRCEASSSGPGRAGPVRREARAGGAGPSRRA